MAELNYCVRCGERLAERLVEAEGRHRLVCEGCGYIHYLNPKVVAATLPVVDGKVALIRRAIAPAFGSWSFSAGYVELGESVEDAARRETQEETCMEVRLGRLLNVYSRAQAGVVVIAYMAEWVGGEMRPGSEALEVALFGPEEIPWTELAFPTVVSALHDWMESVRVAS